MKTEFVTFEVPLIEGQDSWHTTVEDHLRTYGEPLRWAITQVDQASQFATIEAVVTQSTPG